MNIKFVGIVIEISDENNLVFRSDNKLDCHLKQIVGIKIMDNIYVLASINKIDVNYFLNDVKDYFTTLASLNKLSDLSKGTRNPKYSHQITASYIGIYKFDPTIEMFIESDISINLFTPKIFQEVVSFDFTYIQSIYGLPETKFKSFHTGKLLYPNYSSEGNLPDVNISVETFNSHTLISGVTGSGKSRLAALIVNHLALNGGHVTIIDPHSEYIKFVNTGIAKVNVFSNNLQLIKKQEKVIYREIVLTNKYLVPQVIIRLLPGLSSAQQTYIYDVYSRITKDSSYLPQKLTIKKYVDIILSDFKEEYNNYGYSTVKLSQAHEYAKMDFKDDLSFTKRFIQYLDKEVRVAIGSVGKIHVIYAVLKKIIEIYEDKIFQDNNPNISIPAWLDIENRNTINIFNLDYDENDEIRRYLNAIMSCFFIPQDNEDNIFRILIIEEAHLLLKENDTTGTKELLSRLLRESRKYGLSIIFLTQNEKDVSENIKSQFQNNFRFREEFNEKLRFLNNQTCICSLYRAKLDFPMRVDYVEKNIS